MARLIEFKLREGGTILVEVESPLQDSMQPAGVREHVEKAGRAFEEALSGATAVFGAVGEWARSVSERTSEVQVQFGLKLDAKAGIFLASTGIEGQFSVTLKWAQSAGGRKA